MYATMIWSGNDLAILDQTLLPKQVKYLTCDNYHQVKDAIKTLQVRGAPAIGAAAAFAMVLGAKEINRNDDFINDLKTIRDDLIAARPTAVNLAWAAHKLYNIALCSDDVTVDIIIQRMEDAAIRIQTEDVKINKKMGEYGAEVVPQNAVVITHCNAGAVATCGWGTALGVIRSAYAQKKIKMVYADETRPLLQGSRLTAYELHKDGIPVRVITDGMAAWTIKEQGINFAITGADRIALNGDSANKIGTYGLALICKAHNVPFYIAAPVSTFDFTAQSGKDIPVELRNQEEVLSFNGVKVAPEGVGAFNPAFDVTPAELISGIITEYGVLRPPYTESIALLRKKVAETK